MNNKHQGFTLIEILVVVFIISIVTLVATMNFGNQGNTRIVDSEASRLEQILTLVAQTAILEQTDLGVGLWRDGYAVWRYDVVDSQWKLIQHDRVLTTHTLPDDLQLTLRLERLEQILPQTPKGVRGPQLWFSVAGSALPAVVSVTSGEVTEDLIIENNGAITVKRAE